MEFKEIIEKLKDISNNIDEFAYGDFPSELGATKEVYSQGGIDKGSDWKRVYYFTDHDLYISFEGFYSSYNGVDFYDEWDDHVKEVSPQEKTITIYI